MLLYFVIVFLNVTAPTDSYTYRHALSLHDSLPISSRSMVEEHPRCFLSYLRRATPPVPRHHPTGGPPPRAGEDQRPPPQKQRGAASRPRPSPLISRKSALSRREPHRTRLRRPLDRLATHRADEDRKSVV